MLQLFDYDQDGVVSMKEGMGMLRCLGLPTDEANVSEYQNMFLLMLFGGTME